MPGESLYPVLLQHNFNDTESFYRRLSKNGLKKFKKKQHFFMISQLSCILYPDDTELMVEFTAHLQKFSTVSPIIMIHGKLK